MRRFSLIVLSCIVLGLLVVPFLSPALVASVRAQIATPTRTATATLTPYVDFSSTATPTDTDLPTETGTATQTATATRTPTVTPLRDYLSIVAKAPPTATQTATPVPSATPVVPSATPQPGIYTEHESLGLYNDELYVFGEIVNLTKKPIYQPKIIAKFYDASGAFVATEDNVTVFLEIDPGQRCSFWVGLNNPPAGIVRYETTVVPSPYTFPSLPVSVLSQQERENDGPEVFGDVQNNQSKQLRSIGVTATFYDANHNVVDVEFTYLDALAPGQIATYRIDPYKQGFTFASYTVQAQGLVR